jgi:hypothetical protein
VENKSDRNVTLLSVGGALLHPDTNAVLKNVRGPANKLLLSLVFSSQLTSLKYDVPLVENGKLQLPYTFYSE